MSKVQAVTESTTEEMSRLHKLAQTEGARTKFSTNEVAQSMYVLGQAGLDASKQMQVLPQVLDLATAGDMELARSADIMIGTLNGMNLQMTDSARVIDVMAKTANISAIDLNDYGESMKYIAPTAAALGISIEEVSAYIAIMGNNGEK
jgi:TP901 family phage tail tape measure protein